MGTERQSDSPKHIEEKKRIECILKFKNVGAVSFRDVASKT
jgi:hypothetical protein